MNHHESSNFRIPQPVAATVAPTVATNPLGVCRSPLPAIDTSAGTVPPARPAPSMAQKPNDYELYSNPWKGLER